MIRETAYRQDRSWMAGLLFENQAWKFACLMLGIGFMAMMALLYWDMKRPKAIYAFDGSTGRTYLMGKLTQNHLENMLMYATKTFISDFLDYDYLYIERARLAAYNRMSPALRVKFRDELSAEGAIKDAISNKTKFELSFITEPSVIARSHPNYRTFCRVKRVIKFPDGRTSEKEFNLRVTLKMMDSSPDRPDGLYVTEVERIDPNDKKTLDAMLNQIR